MIRISIKGIQNLYRSREKIMKLKSTIPLEIEKIANNFGNRVVRTSVKDYLSGPRPERLGVVTGLLSSNIRSKVSQTGNTTEIKVGTWVPYGRIHEFGGIIQRVSTRGKAYNVKIKKRPYLKPAVLDNWVKLREDLRGFFGKAYGK